MDIPALTSLLSTSTSTLAALHAELGHPPDQLQQALALLAETVRSTVDAQIAAVRAQVDQVGRECEGAKARAEGLRKALGEETMLVGIKTGRAGKKSGEKARSNETLLLRKARLEQEASQLEETYNARCDQVDTLLEQIQHLAPVLEGETADNQHTDDPIVPALPQRDVIQITTDATVTEISTASTSYLQALHAHLTGLEALQQARSERFQAYVRYTFNLWGTLFLRPAIESDAFERAICRAAGLVPVMESVEVEEGVDERTGEVRLVRRTLFQGQFKTVDDEEWPMEHGEEVLLPSVTTLSRLRTLVEGLESERARREGRIQTLYDELFTLWSRFDCAENEMDDFVLQNMGLSLESIENYECELDKMLKLKAQHSLIFIARIREQMTQYSQSARLSQAEAEALFPEFFIPLPDAQHAATSEATPQPGAAEAYDDLLAAHEQAIPRILALIEAKAPLMKLVDRYEEVCREEDELLESAKNTARLFPGAKKGATGAGGKVEKPKRDPGRLLREEKMRKRVKVLKPKLEAEMMKAIPAWEQENGGAFMLDGERYMDHLEALVAARKPVTSIPPVSSVNSQAGQKRGRAGSVGSSAAPTPSISRVNSMVLSTPLGPSSAHNRTASSSSSVSAAGRGKAAPPQTPSQAPLAKKARLANANGTGTGTARPATRIAGPTPAGAGRSAGATALGSSTSSMLGRTPAAMQGARKGNPNVSSAVGPPRRPGGANTANASQSQQQQQQQGQHQQMAITLLPPSAPFRPRASIGPFAGVHHHNTTAAETEESMLHNQRFVSGSSNLSFATSNAGTVIIHASAPQHSMFGNHHAGEEVEEEQRHVTAPLFFDGRKKVVGGGGEVQSGLEVKPRGNRSRPSLSLQKSLMAHPDDAAAGDVTAGGGGPLVPSSSSMRLVSSEIARRMGTAVGASATGGSGGNWDRLVEEEDDLEEEDLIMGSVVEEGEEDLEQEEEAVGGLRLPMSMPAVDEEVGGVRRSRRVVAAAAY
ncbi:unnamed protein product [Tilletia controversa]|uniref:Uncharacterized protein n=2 Tax=Tilletia TaxID=13289 RepID=A0A177VH36_9BASI|nr:hypothetical protein CF336_g2138 [Tilletia laevis]KAE8264457.1 hypothetical protein A4X03_0g933 [Tilletia caries]CAD6900944.1 unnamed protein product [Tilletia controversa]CAD6892308.1 unnamed protein product [Tilletia caries]CAD6896407.1 unnamed protein product [Tilletia caries]